MKLGGSSMPPPAPPPIPEPVRIPNPMDQDVMAARKAKVADEFANRKGRDSTDLTSGTAGQAYSRTTLG